MNLRLIRKFAKAWDKEHMKEYQTSQRMAIMSFFEKNPQMRVSSDDVLALLSSEVELSRSAVYRNLNKMVDEKLLEKSVQPNGRKTLYQYAGIEHGCSRVHLRCERCGKTFHMEREDDDKKLDSLLRANGLSLDNSSTVLLGTCKDCNYDK